MKRKDWKIKDWKKSIYDKYGKNKVNKKSYFLKKLLNRKVNFFLKKNLVQNYYVYRFFLKNFQIAKLTYFYKFKFKLTFFTNTFPDFFFSKKLFNSFNDFCDFSENNKITFFNLKNKSHLYKNYFYNSNIFIDSRNIKILVDESNKSESKNFVSIKSTPAQQHPLNKILNNFINYNLNIFLSLEIYKLSILLYLNKIILKYI